MGLQILGILSQGKVKLLCYLPCINIDRISTQVEQILKN